MSGGQPIEACTLGAFIAEQEARGAYLWTDKNVKIEGVHPRWLIGERTYVEMPDKPDCFVLTKDMVRHYLVRLWPSDYPSG